MKIPHRSPTHQSLDQKLFGLLVSSVKDYAIFMIDPMGYIMSWNKGAEHIKGYTENEVIGKHISIFYTPDEISQNEPQENLKMAFAQGSFEREGWRVRKNGSMFWANVVFTPLIDDRGTLLGFAKVTRDMTEAKRANERKEQLNMQLEVANRELESFSYSVSHDLRTPLRAVAGFSTILQDGINKMAPAERDRITRIIVDNAALMGRLIDDLLEFSRLGRKELRFTRCNMDELVNDCIKELTYSIEKHIEFQIADLPFCEADTSMVKQVWMNLLGNAIKYSSKTTHPRINVGAKTGKKYITYFVKDNGVGFDMKYASKLFGVFQRLHRKDEFDGTGVGLALAKRVTDRHQGKIWAEASEGKGACFYFSMPLKQE